LLQHTIKMETERQKQEKKRTRKKKEAMGREGEASRMGLFSFAYQCPKCLTHHKGSVMSEKPEMEIECLESMEDNMMGVTDEHFVMWLAERQHNKKLHCNHIHYIVGKPVFNKNTKQHGHHELYNGKYDDDTFKMLEERAKRRSIYL